MPADLNDCMFVLLPEWYHPHYGYEMGVVWMGCQGIHSTHFFCGHDRDWAEDYIRNLNYARGHTPDFVTAVLDRITGLDKIKYYNA